MASVGSLKPVYYLTVWSVITSVLPFTAGAAYKVKDGFPGDQLSVFTVELIILSALCVILCFCDIAKTRDFYPKHIEGQGTSPLQKTSSDVNKSKMGLLDDESRIDVDPELYMAGTDNLKLSTPDLKGGINPRFQTPANRKSRVVIPETAVSFRDSGQKLLKTPREEPDSLLDKSGNDNTRSGGNNESKNLFAKTKMKNYILSQDTPEHEEIHQRNVLTEGSISPIHIQKVPEGSSNTLPDEKKLRQSYPILSTGNYIKSLSGMRGSNANITEFSKKFDHGENQMGGSSIEKLPILEAEKAENAEGIFVVEDQGAGDGFAPNHGGKSPRLNDNKASNNTSNKALASQDPTQRQSRHSMMDNNNISASNKNRSGSPGSALKKSNDNKLMSSTEKPNAKTPAAANNIKNVDPKKITPGNKAEIPKPGSRNNSPGSGKNNDYLFVAATNGKNISTPPIGKRTGSPSNIRSASPANTNARSVITPATNNKTNRSGSPANNKRNSINKGVEETRGRTAEVRNSQDSVVMNNNPDDQDSRELVISPVNNKNNAGTHLTFPNPDRLNSAMNKNNVTSPYEQTNPDNASDNMEQVDNARRFGTTNNLSVNPPHNVSGEGPTDNRLSNEFKDFQRLHDGSGNFIPSSQSEMAYNPHNMSGITDINRPGNPINPHVQSGDTLPDGANTHLMDSKFTSGNFEKKASTSFLRSLFNKKNNAVQPISSSPKNQKSQPRFVTEGLSEQPSAPQLNTPEKKSIEKSPELKRASTQRVGTRNQTPVNKSRGSKTPNKRSGNTLSQSNDLLESVQDDNILDDSRMREPEIDFSEDSKISMTELDNFAYEDTPSNYNQLNQRFEGESKYIHNRSYMNNKNSQFSKVGGKRILPQLSNQTSLQGDLGSFEKKGTTLYARVETSTPSTNNFMKKGSTVLPEITKK